MHIIPIDNTENHTDKSVTKLKAREGAYNTIGMYIIWKDIIVHKFIYEKAYICIYIFLNINIKNMYF